MPVDPRTPEEKAAEQEENERNGKKAVIQELWNVLYTATEYETVDDYQEEMRKQIEQEEKGSR